jgi:cytochrome c biogenesis protein ResB
MKHFSINKIKEFFSSLRLTVFCLVLLAFLTVLGTVYQVHHGLYAAQEKFFNSIFFIYGIPLPSAQAVMWLLFINLIFVLIFKISYKPKNYGLVILHLGLLMLLVSGFITLHFSKESFLQLAEGGKSYFSEDYYRWCLNVEENLPAEKQEYNLTIPKLSKQGSLDLGENSRITVKQYFVNSQLFETPFAGTILKEFPLNKNHENNFPGLILDFKSRTAFHKIYLCGLNQPRYRLDVDGGYYIFTLRRQAYELPMGIELIDVRRELHPGTEIAKSYESQVRLHAPKSPSRLLNISMNKPLRYDEYTVYQASYGLDSEAKEFAVLAVVKNRFRLLPYIASLIMALGIFSHFVANFINFLRSKGAAQ